MMRKKSSRFVDKEEVSTKKSEVVGFGNAKGRSAMRTCLFQRGG